jgi:phosphatidate phosphatase APP1
MAIRASVASKEVDSDGKEAENFRPRFPIQAYRLLSSNEFNMKIIGFNDKHQQVYKKVFESDSYGNFYFKIPLTDVTRQIEAIQIYETKTKPGLEIHLGAFIPLRVQNSKKVIICDFDKTLVETKYSSTKEVYNSLTKPLESFPTLNNSVKILQDALKQGYHPFILSASPHFYEDAIRDWLYQNQIYTAGIFLKDYRKIFSIWDGNLTPKDIKIQGLYKFNHLLDILLMTGVPDSVVLMGDNFESDPLIYLSLAKILKRETRPWDLWNSLKKLKAFQLSRKQNSQFLNKIYQLDSLLARRAPGSTDVKIYIRRKASEQQIKIKDVEPHIMKLVELYDGGASLVESPAP